MIHILLKYMRETLIFSKKRAEPDYNVEVEYLHLGHGFQNSNYFNVTVGLLRCRLVEEVF